MSNVRGKTIVITGASAGTGAAAARELHRLGAHVVPVGRSPQKTAAVARELGVQSFTVDFSDLRDVQRLAQKLLSTLPRIHALAVNAGGIPPGSALTEDGLEPTFQVNVIGPWLLLRLLEPHLASSRIVSTSSTSHVKAQLNLDEINGTGNLRPHEIYAWAKLAFALLLREFARRHSDVLVADFHPGIIASDFGRYLGKAGALVTALARPFLDTPEDGARRLVHLLSTDEDIAGRYYHKERPAPGSPLLYDPDLCAALWNLAEEVCDTFLPPTDIRLRPPHAP